MYAIKVKNKDLYLNLDSLIGYFISSYPYIASKKQITDIFLNINSEKPYYEINSNTEELSFEDDIKNYILENIEDLEIKEIKIELI
jgi:hypothetical protein